MFNKKVVYEFNSEGLQQLKEDNKRAADVKGLYKVIGSSMVTVFIIFLV